MTRFSHRYPILNLVTLLGQGPWLCGIVYSAADIGASALLYRLYQLGLDEVMWKNGTRPHVAVYAELAFRRPSFEKATDWRSKASEYVKLRKDQPSQNGINVSTSSGDSSHNHELSKSIEAAKFGLGTIAILAGIFIIRKILRK